MLTFYLFTILILYAFQRPGWILLIISFLTVVILLYHKTIGKMVFMAELQLCTNLAPSIPLTVLLALITILLRVVLSTPTPLCLLLLFTTHQFHPSTAFRVICSTRVFYLILVDLLPGILMALFVFAATLIPHISVGRLIPLVQTIQMQSLIGLNSLMAFN